MSDRNTERDIAYFDRLWKDGQPKDGMQHTKETWDRIAEGWNNDPPKVRTARNRQSAKLTEYLLERGVLTSDTEVIDIGCGAGKYAVEFAGHVKRVTCSDISPKMLDLCRNAAEEKGVSNLDFSECDFLNCDIEAAGLKNRYDLVFTSLTPAVDGSKSIKKLCEVSRKWCFNNSFVYRKDPLRAAVMEDVFGLPVSLRWGNTSVYCLFNILWQLGYTPELCYSREVIEDAYDLDFEFAKTIAVNIIRNRAPSEEEIRKVYDYLAEKKAVNGKVKKGSDSLFAWMLWEV